MITSKVRELWHDKEAVSPVIGVILMVAVTVVLAAVIGAFVFGLGDSLNDPSPNTQLEFDYDADADNVAVIHDGGDTLTSDNTGTLRFKGDWGTSSPPVNEITHSNLDSSVGFTSEAAVTGPIRAGDELYNTANDSSNTVEGDVDSGEAMDVIWSSNNDENSQVIASWEAP